MPTCPACCVHLQYAWVIVKHQWSQKHLWSCLQITGWVVFLTKNHSRYTYTTHRSMHSVYGTLTVLTPLRLTFFFQNGGCLGFGFIKKFKVLVVWTRIFWYVIVRKSNIIPFPPRFHSIRERWKRKGTPQGAGTFGVIFSLYVILHVSQSVSISSIQKTLLTLVHDRLHP